MSAKKDKVVQVAAAPDPPEGECICSVRFCAFVRQVCLLFDATLL
jgi:hypothetical protein